MKITTVGIDLAKNVFQVHGVDEHGKVVLRKQLKRDQMAAFFVNLPPSLIGMEACGSAFSNTVLTNILDVSGSANALTLVSTKLRLTP